MVSIKQQDDIARFFEHIQTTAREAFEQDGVCVPAAIFLLEEEEAVLPLGRLGGDKDVASMLLKKLIEQMRPLAFALVTEAWMAKARQDGKSADAPDVIEEYHGRLTARAADGKEQPKPGVKEGVMLQCCSATGENFMLTAEIVRNPASKPALLVWERMENGAAEGRFVFDVVPLVERQ